MTRRCTCPRNVPSSLETSRKRSKVVKSFCKNCGGKFVVDGIEPMSKSVLGTVGREVANSISPEFNWKTVTKGKRSRKAVARCMNRNSELGNKSPKRVGDFSGSDSDKVGETGNGQFFSDKAEFVPPKKRRHFYRSPSPSSRPSYGAESISPSQMPTPSHSEGHEHLSDHNGSSGSYTNRLRGQAGKDVDIGAVDAKASKLANGVFYGPDFHGISLLAAAACINSTDDDVFNVKADAVEVSSAPQRSDGSTSSLPETQNTRSESGKQLHKQDESVELAAVGPFSPKVDRLHWDLNAPMEAWGQPIDDDREDSSIFISTAGMPSTPLEKDGLAVEKVFKDKENDAEMVLPLDPIENANECSISKLEDGFCCPQRLGVEENSLSTLNGSSREPANLAPMDKERSASLLIRNEFCDNSPEAESCQSSEVSGVCLETKSDTMAVAQDKDSCRNAIPSSMCNLLDNDVAFRDDSGSEKCDAPTHVAEDSQKITELLDNKTSMEQEMSLDSCKILGAENPGCISANSSQPLSKHSSVTTSDIFIAGVSDDSSDVKGQQTKLLADSIVVKSAGEDSGSKEILFKHEDLHPHHISNRESEENHKDCLNLDARQEDIMEASKKVAELEAGYDSPYEDGELRGSILYSWEENEYMDGDQECVDYESDGRGGEEFDAGDLQGPNVVEADPEGTDKRSFLAVHHDTDGMKSGSGRSPRMEKIKFEKIEASAEKLSNQGSGTTEELAGDVIVDRNYGRVRRHQVAADHLDADEEKGSGREEVRSKIIRGKFQSRFEGASSFDTMEGDFVHSRRFRDGAPYFRDERDGVPDRLYKGYRPAFHSRERSGGDGECDYWESRNRYPSSYRSFEGRGPTRQRMTGANSRGKFGGVDSRDQKQHPLNYSSRAERDGSPDRLVSRYGPGQERDRNAYWEPRMRYPSDYDGEEDNGQTRSRNAVSPVDKFGGCNSYDRKQSMDYPSKSMQRPLGWNRSLNDREYLGGPRRFSGFNGNRGGPRKFSEGFSRGFREEYHPSHDEDPSSVRPPHSGPWRGERNYFPHTSRGAHASGAHGGSRSGSRLRSPHAWVPAQRERNVSTRRRSRSPEFRPETRMERIRVPYQKSSFGADYDDSYTSPPPRGRFSPPRSFRGEANDNDNFRHRRPSFNGSRQGQRLDSAEGRKSEELGEADDSSYLRHRRPPFNAFRHGGLPEEGLKSGDCKTQDRNEDKEQDNRSETIH